MTPPRTHSGQTTKEAAANMAAQTPMMRQYLSAKVQHPDALVLFRMGDFYELFFEDAVEAAQLLELTLTSRNKKDADPIPMAGVPHHALAAYVPRLLAAGRKVAICEQLEDPRDAKGIVRRGVVRLITPGVVLDDAVLDRSSNNYLAAIWRDTERGGPVGIAWVDVSTGERRAARLASVAAALEELGRIEARELLVAASDDAMVVAAGHLDVDLAISTVEAPTATDPVEGANAMVAAYVGETQKGGELALREVEIVTLEHTMRLGPRAVRNLELVRTMADHDRKGSVLGLVDRTRTAMGGRAIKRWLLYPLTDLDAIGRRQAAVAAFVDDPVVRADVGELLDSVYDLERLVTRITAKSAGPRELVALASSLERVPALVAVLSRADSKPLTQLATQLDPVVEASRVIRRALVDEPPANLRDGGVIREGYDAELDQLIAIAREGKQWFSDYAERLRASTGISSLKIKFNNVFGYFIEVTRANLHLVPDDWLRKQTLVNCERYYTTELKDREEKVLGAEDRRALLEQRFFDAVSTEAARQSARIQATATRLAGIDALCGLADLAARHNYVRPTLVEAPVIDISEGRHPVIEALLPAGEFVPNDTRLDANDDQILIITGPNMAGKSTVMRQVALITLLAQTGSFVPAARATIGVADQIFTRVGASDNLSRGRSTFMVEMCEAAEILTEATARSLVILDEIGRGTSTFDGVSIAWSVAEHLHDVTGCRTLFATHYHELTALAQTRERIVNMTIAVKEWQDDIVFLRQLVAGGTNRSYGIQVARLAGLPGSVIARAKEVLATLEDTTLGADSRPRLAAREPAHSQRSWQLDLFASGPDHGRLIEAITAVDPDDLSPREALALVYRLRDLLGER